MPETSTASQGALPEFRKHGFDKKFVVLQETDFRPMPRHVSQFIQFLSAANAGDLSGIKILDLGCGRGELVGALRDKGARAYGIEVDARFVNSGAILDRLHEDEYPLLSTINSNGKSIFPAGYFDIVISDQVLEHVADLKSVTSEIFRVLRPGGLTCHQFPARHRMMEPHYKLPLVHWLPKGRLRQQAIKLLLWLGLSREFFPQYDLKDRAAIIFKYSVEETFYRKVREIKSTFQSAGLIPIFRSMMHLYVESRLRRKIPYALPLAEYVSAFRMVMFCARKPAQ